jgi:hypothetical protein
LGRETDRGRYDPARRAEGRVNMTMRQRADDGNAIMALGNVGAAFEQCLEAGDPPVRPAGKQQRALLDLAGLAVAFAQQDGRGEWRLETTSIYMGAS